MPAPPGSSPPEPGPEDDPEVTGALHLLREGDAEARGAARGKLLACANRQFSSHASRMLDRFFRLRRFEQTGDVLNKALLRLDEALRTCSPETPDHFCRLVAKQIRYELLDLVRHYFGPLGIGTNQDGGVLPADDEAVETRCDDGPQSLAEWTEFHERVGRLPAELREVVELHWYQGLTLQQIADLTGRTQQAVRRLWRAARESLGRWLGGGPGGAG